MPCFRSLPKKEQQMVRDLMTNLWWDEANGEDPHYDEKDISKHFGVSSTSLAALRANITRKELK